MSNIEWTESLPRNYASGPRNAMWKGGRSIASNGYVLVRVGASYHLADVRGYAYEHRIAAENEIGRKLRPGEQVHHKNGNKQDNRPNNLEVLTFQEHRFHHRQKNSDRRLPGEKNFVVECACGCGESFPKYDLSGRPRKYVSGHNPAPAAVTQDLILSTLGDDALSRSGIVLRTGKPQKAIGTCLSKLKKKGLVRSVSHGVWEKAQND